jgi:hypothetical protein
MVHFLIGHMMHCITTAAAVVFSFRADDLRTKPSPFNSPFDTKGDEETYLYPLVIG